MRLIILERLVKAAVLLAFAVSLLATRRLGFLQPLIQEAQEQLNLSAGHGLIGQLVTRAVDYVGRFPHLSALAVAALLYAALEGTEGVGLAMGRRWAEYLTVLATAVFIPFEAYEILHKVTPIRVGALALNVAIVVYLAYRKRLFVDV